MRFKKNILFGILNLGLISNYPVLCSCSFSSSPICGYIISDDYTIETHYEDGSCSKQTFKKANSYKESEVIFSYTFNYGDDCSIICDDDKSYQYFDNISYSHPYYYDYKLKKSISNGEEISFNGYILSNFDANYIIKLTYRNWREIEIEKLSILTGYSDYREFHYVSKLSIGVGTNPYCYNPVQYGVLLENGYIK